LSHYLKALFNANNPHEWKWKFEGKASNLKLSEFKQSFINLNSLVFYHPFAVFIEEEYYYCTA